MKNTSATLPLSALYEKAWNETVNSYSDWKRGIVIEEPFGRHADEAAREAILLAEKWEQENERRRNSGD